MTTETITLTYVCPGGNHLTFNGTGAKTIAVDTDFATITTPISDDEAEAFAKVIAKMAKAGRTNAQARAILEAGVTITV